MGLVYRVRHLGWDVGLALKVPRTEFVASLETVGDFAAGGRGKTWVGLGLYPHTVRCGYHRRDMALVVRRQRHDRRDEERRGPRRRPLTEASGRA
ncbi:hypothetical protein HLK59_23920 [Streptomyces sp. S3(2020)]|uniref:hypothetical protein n=1 Tax=Streptomyces sp. S3(2020) TaxID=2732044 RepID=UPI0014896872|nr:hypothetical protein [Streptomyces sp. S3(2020)]NNN33352.1 hypothetical protein [Streptomyces sp. S3(2020)]